MSRSREQTVAESGVAISAVKIATVLCALKRFRRIATFPSVARNAIKFIALL